MKLAGVKQDQQFLLIAVLVGVLGGWGYVAYLVSPLMRSVSSLGGQIRTAELQLRTVQQTIAQEPSLRRDRDALSQKLQHLKTSLPSEQGMPTVIQFLSDLASQTQVKIRTIFPQRTVESLGLLAAGKEPTQKPNELYKEVAIQVDAVSGYHQLGNFLSRVESGEQPMELKSLRISADPKDPRRHSMKIVISAYFSTVQLSAFSPAKAGGDSS